MRKPLSVILAMLLVVPLAACVPQAPSPATPTPGSAGGVGIILASTPTEPGWSTSVPDIASCENAYLPSEEGSTWTYAGSNSSTGTYSRTDTIVSSEDDSFVIATQLTKTDYTQEFSCRGVGLINLEPNQSDIAAMFHGPSGDVTVHRVSNSGVTLPADIQAGDSWEQVFVWDATGPDASGSGTFTYAFTAAGVETVSVPAGTFDAPAHRRRDSDGDRGLAEAHRHLHHDGLAGGGHWTGQERWKQPDPRRRIHRQPGAGFLRHPSGIGASGRECSQGARLLTLAGGCAAAQNA